MKYCPARPRSTAVFLRLGWDRSTRSEWKISTLDQYSRDIWSCRQRCRRLSGLLRLISRPTSVKMARCTVHVEDGPDGKFERSVCAFMITTWKSCAPHPGVSNRPSSEQSSLRRRYPYSGSGTFRNRSKPPESGHDHVNLVNICLWNMTDLFSHTPYIIFPGHDPLGVGIHI